MVCGGAKGKGAVQEDKREYCSLSLIIVAQRCCKMGDDVNVNGSLTTSVLANIT
jgi:hypothetical protein